MLCRCRYTWNKNIARFLLFLYASSRERDFTIWLGFLSTDDRWSEVNEIEEFDVAGNLQSFVGLFVVGITRVALQCVTVIFGDGIGVYSRATGGCECDRKWLSIVKCNSYCEKLFDNIHRRWLLISRLFL